MNILLFMGVWLLGPPILITFVAWLAAPRLDVELKYLHIFFGTLVGWIALHVTIVFFLITIPWFNKSTGFI